MSAIHPKTFHRRLPETWASGNTWIMGEKIIPHKEIVNLARVIAPHFNDAGNRNRILHRAFGGDGTFYSDLINALEQPINIGAGFEFAERVLYIINDEDTGLAYLGEDKSLCLFLQAIKKNEPTNSPQAKKIEQYLEMAGCPAPEPSEPIVIKKEESAPTETSEDITDENVSDPPVVLPVPKYPTHFYVNAVLAALLSLIVIQLVSKFLAIEPITSFMIFVIVDLVGVAVLRSWLDKQFQRKRLAFVQFGFVFALGVAVIFPMFAQNNPSEFPTQFPTQDNPSEFPTLLPIQDESSIAAFRWQEDDNAAGDIYVMKDGGMPHQLSTNTGDEHYPIVSPHGDSVLYIQDNDGELSIMQHDFEFVDEELQSGVPFPILEGNTGEYTLNNIPTGSTIAISGMAFAPDGSFALVPLRQNGQVNLYELATTADGFATLNATPLVVDAQYPAIQPGGNLVAFERDGQIWVMFVQSGEIINLSHPAEAQPEQPATTDTCFGASFNALGTEIYFTCSATNGTMTIWRYGTLGVYQKLPAVSDVAVCPEVQFRLPPGYFCVTETDDVNLLWFARPNQRSSVFWAGEYGDVIISQFNWTAVYPQ